MMRSLIVLALPILLLVAACAPERVATPTATTEASTDGGASGNGAAGGPDAGSPETQEMARFVERFMGVNIGPTDSGDSYVLIAELPPEMATHLPDDSDVIGTIVNTPSSQAQALVDIPLEQEAITAHYREALAAEGWTEQDTGASQGSPEDPSSGPLIFCAEDSALFAVAYDTTVAPSEYTSTILSTIEAGVQGSPCATAEE